MAKKVRIDHATGYEMVSEKEAERKLAYRTSKGAKVWWKPKKELNAEGETKSGSNNGAAKESKPKGGVSKSTKAPSKA